MDKKGTDILLRKYFEGRLTSAEVEQFKELIENIDTVQLEENTLQIWNSYTDSGKRYPKELEAVSKKIDSAISSTYRRNTLYYVRRIASSVLLPLLLTTTLYLIWERQSGRQESDPQFIVQTGKGERTSVILSDSTKVYLNAQSTLSYPASFNRDERTVRLTGEGYFEVAHNARKPFVVNTGTIQVKVLGTAFNLYAYQDNTEVEASLVEGSVEVQSNGNPRKTHKLKPNQKAVYNRSTGELKIVDTDLRLETAWKNGVLNFRAKTFAAIIPQLELFYGVNIQAEGELPQNLFTGSFYHDNINTVLLNLQHFYNFTYEKYGQNIYLKFL